MTLHTNSCNFHFVCILQFPNRWHVHEGSSHVCVGSIAMSSIENVRRWFTVVSHWGTTISWWRALFNISWGVFFALRIGDWYRQLWQVPILWNKAGIGPILKPCISSHPSLEFSYWRNSMNLNMGLGFYSERLVQLSPFSHSLLFVAANLYKNRWYTVIAELNERSLFVLIHFYL